MCVYECIYVCVLVSWHAHECQKETFGSLFLFLSCVLGNPTQVIGLYLLSCLNSLYIPFPFSNRGIKPVILII